MDTTIKDPRVTVLMPVYNGEKYLKEAIESILSQTFTDFEFLIINDGSADKSAEILQSFNDPRIRLVHNERNIGLIGTLNKGIKLSRGKYIARMDCDDISLPKRLSVQVRFMEKHAEIGVCGSWVKIIGLKKSFAGEYFQKDEDLRAYMLLSTPFAHPSVMIRKDVLDTHNLEYDESYKHAEDYELWSRIIKHTKISNIPEVLLGYRKHPESVSQTHTSIQIENANKVRVKLLAALAIVPSAAEFEIHKSFIPPTAMNTEEFIVQLENWFNKILTANRKTKVYSQNSLEKVLSRRWFDVCSANAGLGLRMCKKFRESPLCGRISLKNGKRILKFFMKCLLAGNKVNSPYR